MATPRALLKMFLGERPRLVQRISRIVDNEAEAEDLAQESFVKLWRRQPKDDDSVGLLYRTAHNLALDHLRAQKVRQRHQEGAQVEAQDDAHPSAESIAATLERWGDLVAELDALPARTRRIFLLNRVEGETYAAIAERLEVSVSTVEKEMMRAMRVCRQWQRRHDEE
ncbi:sigma-70 family RNA polymerase sigma factor [Halomonas sp. MCCC 1A11036]|uniref:Sigma-70 family RNA polymerase sigma factor n=1 Tax=Billgrantia zhangzhouensis TaxID=2733481 RepID=A0ABS9AH55_9GAMM|nr:sigma-70 family RNA polymerase sigma factor [Halomonas zhangzhouensis]MCE8021095.1 sigma-70 family RNA polymerase sigma factor [Halomonas zhangzhouensis]